MELGNRANAAKDPRKIVEARITPLPQKIGDMLPTVWAKLEGDTVTEYEVLSYFPDEISFSAGEFIGLTVAEARRMYMGRDARYVQSKV